MSLYTDSDILTESDLLAIDPEVSTVADAEGIVVSGSGSIISQAWDECADKILAAVQSFSGDLFAWPGQITALNYLGASRPRLKLTQIVWTASYANRNSPIRRWMIYRALYLFYRAASGRRETDRYERKRDQFEQEGKMHWRTLFRYGLPMVSKPLSAPGATHELNAGTWGASNVTAVAGGASSAPVTYDVAITWVDTTQYASPTNTQNAESGPSATQTITVPAAEVLQVSIASLIPPGTLPDQAGTADGIMIGLNASGWNIYAGPTGGTLYLQNSSPIPTATQTYAFAGPPVATGAAMTNGQVPNVNYTFQTMLNRG